jgi:hypothetical protein
MPSHMRSWIRANSSSAPVGALCQDGIWAAQNSAERGLCPDAMSQTARQAGSIHAAPLVGHAQSTRTARWLTRTLARLLDVNVRTGDLLELSQSGYYLRDIEGTGRVVCVNAGYVLESEQIPVSVGG